ncbi:MAG: glycerol acyltransferase, partial [Mangrovimonas sp.]|nr:glycerol acyltransferase [Mangrovimonas sp.]
MKSTSGLVTAKEVASVIKADKYGFVGTFLGWLLMKVLNISTLNKIYNRNKHLEGLDFVNSILDE